MVKETVQSLKAENNKLKEKVDAVFGELKQLQESLSSSILAAMMQAMVMRPVLRRLWIS